MATTQEFLQSFLSVVDEWDLAVLDAVTKDGETVFKTMTTNVDPESNVLIIYGENCSGKSLLANIIEIKAREERIGARSASMKNRTSSGPEKALLIGKESDQSTGQTSVSFALKSLDATADDENKALSILDEPDIGLSDYYSGAFGKLIGEKTQSFDASKGLVLISHSKSLIRNFLDVVDGRVNTLGINTSKNLEQWLKNDDSASINELLNLKEQGSAKRIAITQAIKSR